MKKIREAYHTGINGDELTGNPKRRHRVAHNLGKIVGKSYDAHDQMVQAMQTSRLEKAMGLAAQPNKIVLEIMKDAAKLGQPGEANPAEGMLRTDSKDQKPLEVQWSAFFKHGSHAPNNKIERTPLIDMPNLMINGEEIPVREIILSSSSAIVDNEMQAPSTTISINQWSHESGKDIEAQQDYKDGIKIDIAPDGTMLFAKDIEGHTGFMPVTPQDTNVISFLEGLQGAVLQTADAYQAMGSIAENGLQ